MTLVRGHRLWLVLALAGLGVVGAGWWFGTGTTPTPPLPDLTGADPEVIDLIGSARRDVLAAPRSGAAWGRLGMVLRAHDFAREADVCFTRAAAREPREPRWPYLRGLTLVLTEPEQGRICLERAVELWGDGPPEPRFRLVEVLLEQGRLDEAEAHLRAAPPTARRELLWARLLAARGDWKAVPRRLERLGGDDHARRQALLLAAQARQRLGDSERAARQLEEAQRLPEDVPWPDPFVEEVERLQVGLRIRLARASLLVRQGRAGEAVRLLEQVVRDHPGSATAWLRLGEVLVRGKQVLPAEQALARAVEIAPDLVEGWFHLGVARVYRGDARAAAEAFGRAIQLKPDHTLAHYNLGRCREQLGDPAGAERAWREALRCQPDYEPARQALARAKR